MLIPQTRSKSWPVFWPGSPFRADLHIEDLRRWLDGEAEERRKLTARLADYREEPAPVSFWQRLFRSR